MVSPVQGLTYYQYLSCGKLLCTKWRELPGGLSHAQMGGGLDMCFNVILLESGGHYADVRLLPLAGVFPDLVNLSRQTIGRYPRTSLAELLPPVADL